MKKYIVAAALAALAGCNKSAEHNGTKNGMENVAPVAKRNSYDKHGIRFEYPQNWEISKDKEIAPGSYTLTVERQDPAEGGIVMFTILSAKLDPENYLERTQRGLSGEAVKQSATVVWDSVRDEVYGNIPCRMAPYSMNLMGIKLGGAVYTFTKGNKTFSGTEYGAVDEIKENEEGFRMIKKTFSAQ